ncbi:MarR family winged helix-turn-helix transcriptional regulator [Chloroflexota bacterium]
MPIKPKTAKKSPMQASDMIEVNHDDVILRTFILFVQTARTILKYADTHLYGNVRLSVIKFMVLRVLASHNRSMKPSEIAEWTQTERHNITALIKRMKKEGLVEAKRDGSDRRYVNVTLTGKGQEVLSSATPAAREVIDDVMSSISEGDAVLLEKLLKVLRQNTHDGLAQVAQQNLPRID